MRHQRRRVLCRQHLRRGTRMLGGSLLAVWRGRRSMLPGIDGVRDGRELRERHLPGVRRTEPAMLCWIDVLRRRELQRGDLSGLRRHRPALLRREYLRRGREHVLGRDVRSVRHARDDLLYRPDDVPLPLLSPQHVRRRDVHRVRIHRPELLRRRNVRHRPGLRHVHQHLPPGVVTAARTRPRAIRTFFACAGHAEARRTRARCRGSSEQLRGSRRAAR